MSTLDDIMCRYALRHGTTAQVHIVDWDGDAIDGMIASVRGVLPPDYLGAPVRTTREITTDTGDPLLCVVLLTTHTEHGTI